MAIFGAQNLKLDQYVGFLNNNKTKIRCLGPINLKKGKLVQFCVIDYGDTFNKCRSA